MPHSCFRSWHDIGYCCEESTIQDFKFTSITSVTKMAHFLTPKFSCLFVLLFAFIDKMISATDSQMFDSSLHVTTDIKFHFATTHVTNVQENLLNVSSTAVFNFSIPSSAFISSLVIESGGKIYRNKVVSAREKEAQKQNVSVKVEEGRVMIHNGVRPAIIVSVKMTTPALSTIVFNMTYEDVLKRRLGKFEYFVPLKTVDEVVVAVSIEELRPLTLMRVKNKKTFNTSIEHPASNKANLVVKKLPNQSPAPLSVTVLFDTARESDVGDVLVGKGYFVHFFSAVILEEVPKDVLLVTQLEPKGKYHEKVKSAMNAILRKMKEKDESIQYYFDDCTGSCHGIDFCRNYLYGDCQMCCKGHNQTHLMSQYNPEKCKVKCDMKMTADGRFRATEACELCCKLKRPSRFNILFYNYKQYSMKEKFLPITKVNIEQAIKYVKDSDDMRWASPNFYRGMKEAFRVLREYGRHRQGKKVIIYIGDGKQYGGYYAKPEKEVLKRNRPIMPVYPLVLPTYGIILGSVKRLAFESGASARMLWDDENPGRQAVRLYNEISTTLLTKVQFSYPEEQIIPDSLTTSYFRNYFNGSELIVAGKLENNDTFVLNATVSGRSSGRRISFQTPINTTSIFPPLPLAGANLEIPKKIWTHLTIQNCMDNLIPYRYFEPNKKYEEIGLDLSLKHQLLTKFTSMIIPSEEDETWE